MQTQTRRTRKEDPPNTEIAQENLRLICEWLQYLSEIGFYGNFSIVFQHGSPVHTRQDSSLKPWQLRVPVTGQQVLCGHSSSSGNS